MKQILQNMVGGKKYFKKAWISKAKVPKPIEVPERSEEFHRY